MAPPTYLGLSGTSLSRVISTVATTGFLLFGYDQGVMSGILTSTPFTTLLPAIKNNSTNQGAVTACYDIGCLFGAILILFIGDVLGRRRAMIAGSIIMIAGVIIQVTAQPNSNALVQFVIGRVITGVGNGINTSTIPTYQAECSKTTNRGLLICIEGGIIAFGSLTAYWIDYGASFGPADLVWRFPIAFQCVFALGVAIPMVFLPDSPRWLLSQGRQDEADRVLAALRGFEVDAEETKLERNIILDSLRASGHAGEKSTPMSALFTNGKTQHFRRMLIGASSQFMQQIGGCNAVIYYFPILFEQSIGQSHNLSLLLGGVNMIVYASFATLPWFIIDRAGRRNLFLWGTVGQCLSMVIVFAGLIPGTSAAAKGSAVGLFTYIASFGASWLPLPWILPAEINPIKTRAKANAMSTIQNWMWNTFVVFITPVMISRIGWGTYVFFAAVNALFLPFIYLYYPETARRSLEEIDIIFAKGYVENISYVKAAKELPLLSDKEVEQYAIRYGLIDASSNATGVVLGDKIIGGGAAAATGTDHASTSGSGSEGETVVSDAAVTSRGEKDAEKGPN